jgi:hypothetical protein
VPAALRGWGSGGAVGRRRGRRLVRSVPPTAWLVGRGSRGGRLARRGWPTRPPGSRGRPTRRLGAGWPTHPAPVGARGTSLPPMWRVSRAGSSPRLGLGRGCRQAPRASARALLAAHGLACTAGERGVAGHVGRLAPRTVIPTLPASIAVNVGIEGSGREIPDVTGVGVEPAGHTLPLYPAPAVPANRTSADGDGAADRPRRRPTSGSRSASGVRRQRRTNGPAAAGLRRYRCISTATSHSTCERVIRATLP